MTRDSGLRVRGEPPDDIQHRMKVEPEGANVGSPKVTANVDADKWTENDFRQSRDGGESGAVRKLGRAWRCAHCQTRLTTARAKI